MPIDGDFNRELHYYFDDGGEIKLEPIKPMSIEEIETVQATLTPDDLVIKNFKDIDYSVDLDITGFDEITKAIMAIELEQQLQNNLYCICEMAKRYVYMLKEKDKANERGE